MSLDKLVIWVGIPLSPIIFFLGSKFFSNEISKLTLYHRNESFGLRFKNVYFTILKVGAILSAVLFFSYTTILKEKWDPGPPQIILVCVLSSLVFVFTARILALWEFRMPRNDERKKEHRERIASFAFSILELSLLTLLLIFCFLVLYGSSQNLKFEVGNFGFFLLLTVGVFVSIAIFSFMGEKILEGRVPDILKE